MDEAKRNEALEAATRMIEKIDDIMISLITVEVQRITGERFMGDENNEVFRVIKAEIKRVYEAW